MSEKCYKLDIWIKRNKIFNEVSDYLLEIFNPLSKNKREKIYLKELMEKFKIPRKMMLDILAELHNAGQVTIGYSPKYKDVVVMSMEYYWKKHGIKPKHLQSEQISA